VAPWPRAAQLTLAFLLGIATALLAVYAYGSLRSGSRPTELSQSPPPGEAKAAADADPTVPVKVAADAGKGEKKSAGKGGKLTGPINLNTAGVAELKNLPGIGPKLSERIVEERAKKPFRSVEDLRRVSGIGPKTIENLRPFVTVDANPVNVAAKEKSAQGD
jgi:competence protein ComEA